MNRYRLSKAAEADLDIIFWQGLERFGIARTERYMDELEAVFAFLARHPEAARLRSEMTPPARAYPQEAHIILYEIVGEEILIIRVRSGRENWQADPRSVPSDYLG